MPASAPTYDLVMLLDLEAEDEARAKPLADARAAIEAQGELLRHDEWGTRALAYAIDRRDTAEYHLLQFHAATPELLRTLDRSLRIADEVLRFRIIKLRPGVPEPPDMPSAHAGPRRAAAETAPAPAAQAAQAGDSPPASSSADEPRPAPQQAREPEQAAEPAEPEGAPEAEAAPAPNGSA
jgi:small subunit ribosomal protein S6